jgi:4-hydroxy-tetrahydrodipicolinate reductase
MTLAIIGAQGRMGTCIYQEAQSLKMDVGALVGNPSNPRDTQRKFCALDTLPPTLTCVIDFSVPQALEDTIKACLAKTLPLVCGVTGLNDGHHHLLKEAAETIPVFYSANMSIGIAVLCYLAKKAAQLLPPDMDREILEHHHRHKKDSPSGTAKLLSSALQEVRPGRVPCAVLRGGGVAGDHSVIFSGMSEVLTLSHRALDRHVFAQGALKAAQWLVDQRPGFYGMPDLLHLPSVS